MIGDSPMANRDSENSLKDILSKFRAPDSGGSQAPNHRRSSRSNRSSNRSSRSRPSSSSSPTSSSTSSKPIPDAKLLRRPPKIEKRLQQHQKQPRPDRRSSRSPSDSHNQLVQTRQLDPRSDLPLEQTVRVPVLSDRAGHPSAINSRSSSSESEILRIYRDFIIAMHRCRVRKQPISFHKFSQKLTQQRQQVRQKHPQKPLVMKVKIVDGKPVISIRPVT